MPRSMFSECLPNSNSGAWTPITTRPNDAYSRFHALTYGAVRIQFTQVYSQKSTSTTFPRSATGVSAGEFTQRSACSEGKALSAITRHDAAAKPSSTNSGPTLASTRRRHFHAPRWSSQEAANPCWTSCVSAFTSVADATEVCPKLVFGCPWLVKAKLHECLEPRLCRRSCNRRHACVPSGRDLHIGRQAGVHETLGVGDCPLVECRNACREGGDERVELGIRERPVHIAVSLGQFSSNVVRAEKHFKRPSAADQVRQTRHRSAAGDHPDPYLPLREHRLLSTDECHVACERDFAAVASGAPSNRRDRHDRHACEANEDVRPRLEAGRALRDALQVVEIGVEVAVVQEEAIDGALEDHDLHLLIGFDRRHDGPELTEKLRTHQIERRIVKRDPPVCGGRSTGSDLRSARHRAHNNLRSRGPITRWHYTGRYEANLLDVGITLGEDPRG